MADTEPLDLDAIQVTLGDARAGKSMDVSLDATIRLLERDVPALIAEVRRLREPTHCPGCDGFQMVTETNGSEHKYGCQGVPA